MNLTSCTIPRYVEAVIRSLFTSALLQAGVQPVSIAALLFFWKWLTDQPFTVQHQVQRVLVIADYHTQVVTRACSFGNEKPVVI